MRTKPRSVEVSTGTGHRLAPARGSTDADGTCSLESARLNVLSKIPPPELASRIGGAYDEYREIGALQRELVERVLPAEWSFAGKAVLDFGCGTGRTLATFAAEAVDGEFYGCDIHEESIAWANAELSPPFSFFLARESPPLPQPDARFDLVYAMSVFTHITTQWGEWLTELHRILAPRGLAVVSVLGPAMARQILGSQWDDRIGMARVDLHKSWDVGGPDVLLSEWWVREHWGRAFEILRFEHANPAAGAGHDLAVMRRRETEVTPDKLAAVDTVDRREHDAIICNLELLWRQQEELGAELRGVQDGRMAAEMQVQELRTELATVRARLDTVLQSNSWRLTAGLRRARAAARRRS